MRKDVRKITEGAAILAILGLYMIMDRQTAGFLNASLTWVVPLPLLVYTAKYGLKDALIPYVAAFLLSFILSGNYVTIVMMVMYGTIGLVYGWGIWRKWDNRVLFTMTVFATGIIYFLSFILFAAFFGYDMNEELITMTNIMENMSIATDALLIEYMRTALVIGLFVGAVLEAFIVHMLGRVLLSRMKILIPVATPLEKFYFPKWLGWVLLIVLFVHPLAQSYLTDNQTLQILFSTYVIAVIILTVDAFILLRVIQRKTKIRSLIPLAVLSLLFISTISIYVFITLGLLDMTTDIRVRLLGAKTNA